MLTINFLQPEDSAHLIKGVLPMEEVIQKEAGKKKTVVLYDRKGSICGKITLRIQF